MKSYPAILLILLSLLTFSCADDLTSIGVGIQPTSDAIQVKADTFHVSTENVYVDYIFSRPDSFLLGSFYNETYGTTRADILAQVNCPVGYMYHPLAQVDSATLELVYISYFGDKNSPMEISAYEMDKKTFSYSTPYPTNLNPTDYSSLQSIVTRNRVITPTKGGGKIAFQVKNSVAQRLFDSNNYTSTEKFLQNFGGIYITTNFGASSLLNIRQINMILHFHYTYRKNNKDTTVNLSRNFPANSEVRQVNRFQFPDRNEFVKERTDVNYVAAPANLQTRVNIPLKKMKERMNDSINGKKLTMNSALMRVDATEISTDTLSHPVVSYMLLIKESAIDRFFTSKELPSDTCAIVGQFTASRIGTTSEYEYYYSFNVAKLVANELKIAEKLNQEPEKNLKMRLIPVRVKMDTNNNITEVSQQFIMSAITIKSGQNAKSPMKINAVYSGF